MTFLRGYIQGPPVPDASVELVVSNGVVNLAPDKAAVFAAAARALVPGGRLALADIVSEKPLTEAITCNAELWASCIGGATQVDAYLSAIEDAGLHIAKFGTTPSTGSCPTRRGARHAPTASRASPCWRGSRRRQLTDAGQRPGGRARRRVTGAPRPARMGPRARRGRRRSSSWLRSTAAAAPQVTGLAQRSGGTVTGWRGRQHSP